MQIDFVRSRIDLIKDYVKDKSVLDLGCVDHDAIKEKENVWLHRIIKENAKSVLGVDLAKNEVELLRKKGYNIIFGNAETINLNEKFDIIFAGNIIEHVSNPGILIANAKKHLKKGGRFIITTDNSYRIKNFFYILKDGEIIPNPDHASGFDFHTLKQLTERYGFKIEKCYYYHGDGSLTPGGLFLLFLASVRKSFSNYFMFVLKAT